MDETTQDPTLAFDRRAYERPPVVDVPGGLALARSLLTAKPAGAPEGVEESAATLRAAADALDRAWQVHLSTGAKLDSRVSDRRIDSAWAALIERIAPFTRLPPDRTPDVALAVQILAVLAPDGLAALKTPYLSQWSFLDARLRRLATAGLVEATERLAGTVFVDEVRDAFEEYGRTLGVTSPQPAATKLPNLLDPLRDLLDAIDEYTVQVVALVRRGRPATVQIVRDALSPLDNFRRTASQRNARSTPDPTPPTDPPSP